MAEGLMLVAVADRQLVGVGQRGRRGADHVVYKLYVHPQHRGRRLGARLLDALTRQLPPDADRLCVEQFVANERAGAHARCLHPLRRLDKRDAALPAHC